MPVNPVEVLLEALQKAANQTEIIGEPEHLRTIVIHADKQKAVLGVTLTSIVYKILHPNQDIRLHQEGMPQGYSGRTFDTKFITPFLKNTFPHFAMAESAWLTRSLEQAHAFTLDFPGKIRNTELKIAFLNFLDQLEQQPSQAPEMLIQLLRLLLETTKDDEALFEPLQTKQPSIANIIEAVTGHIRYNYPKGTVGTARIPVLAIYAVYGLLLPDVRRYDQKILAPLESHTSPDARSKALGDIDVLNPDQTCFEAIEIKHNKPISAEMVKTAYRKFKATNLDRYYILTTNEPNVSDHQAVAFTIEQLKMRHPCQIVVNGVIASLRYYLRLISQPENFVIKYTQLLELEFKRGSGIKKVHLQLWQEIRRNLLNLEPQ